SPVSIRSPTCRRREAQRRITLSRTRASRRPQLDYVRVTSWSCGRRALLTPMRASRPCTRGLGLLLEALDLVLLDHGQADIVETVEQAMLAVRIDVELDHAAVRPPDLLLLQIDRQRGIGAALGVVKQLLQILRRHLHRQHAVLEAVVVEDVAERGRNHAA